MKKASLFDSKVIKNTSVSIDQQKRVKGGTTLVKICDGMKPKSGDEGTHQSKAHLFTNQSANANPFLSALRLRTGL
ncbi:MAG: hypothetical protein AAFV95_17475 [Bacteroidota bacterium]